MTNTYFMSANFIVKITNPQEIDKPIEIAVPESGLIYITDEVGNAAYEKCISKLKKRAMENLKKGEGVNYSIKIVRAFINQYNLVDYDI